MIFRVVVFLVCMSGPLWAFQNVHKIGGQGATVGLHENWSRTTIDRSLGDDQFVSTDGLFLFILESPAAMREPAEFDDFLTTAFNIRAAGMQDAKRQACPYTTRNGVGHAMSKIRCKVNNIPLIYEFHVLGRDGLNYFLVAWSRPRDVDKLADMLVEITAALKMPDESSDWGKTTKPVTIAVKKLRHRISFDVQRSIFTTAESVDDDRFFFLSDATNDMSCNFFIEEATDHSQLARNILNVLKRECPDVKEVKREEITAASRPSRQVTFEDKNGNIYVSTLIPLEQSKFVEIRFHTTQKLEWRKGYLDAVVNSLKIAAPKKVDAFPEVASAPAGPVLSTGKMNLLAASTLAARFSDWQSKMWLTPDGEIIGFNYNNVVAQKSPTEAARILYSFDNFHASHVAGDATTLWFTDTQDRIMRIVGERADVVHGEASIVGSAGGGRLLLVRKRPLPSFTGFEPSYGGRIVIRSPEGDERVVTETVSTITHASMETSGRWIACASPEDWQTQTTPAAGMRLSIIEAENGREASSSSWANITDMTGADGRWLIRGEPRGMAEGLYLVTSDGKARIVISGGDCFPVGMTRDDLYYATKTGLSPVKEDEYPFHVYRIPLASALKDGPLWQPFHGALIQSVAEKAFARCDMDLGARDLLATRRKLDLFFSEAQTIFRETVNAEIPLVPEVLDEIIGDYGARSGLKREGSILLAAALAQSLLARNGEWREETTTPLLPEQQYRDLSEQNPFAVACNPGAIIAGAIHDDEGWYQPAEMILKRIGGRRLLLCRDPEETLQSMFGKAMKTLTETVQDAKKMESLIKILKENAANTHMREKIYEALYAQGRADDIAAIASSFSAPETPLIDLKAALAVRSSHLQAVQRAALIQDLRTAISRFPQEASFYAMLAGVYENEGVTTTGIANVEAAECAKACHEAVIRIARYGNLVNHARRRLEEIELLPEGEDASSTKEQPKEKG